MAIALLTMHQLGAAIAMAWAVVMVLQEGLAMTTIALITTMTMTTATAGNVVGVVAGEQGGRAGAHSGGRVHAQIKIGDDDSAVLDGSLLEDVVMGIGAGAMDGDSPNVGMSNDNDDNDVHHCHLAGPSFWV